MTRHALLTAEDHRDLRVRTERGADVGDAVMFCITMPDEFRRVQNDYPILFRSSADRESFNAVAMFGFQDGENLYLESGDWDARYLPLAMRIQPFLIGAPAPGREGKQVHVDMGSPRIGGGEGMRVFDEDGRPTPYLERIAEELGELDAGYQGAADFFESLRRYDLLEPFMLEVTLADGAVNRLVGFHVIDEARVEALDAAALGDLHAKGHLMPIFMALASLANIARLVDRKNRAMGHG